MEEWGGQLERIGPYAFRIPQTYKQGMRVPGIIFADDELLEQALKDQAMEQVVNVAFLPGIVKASLAMPDIHWGYGFPIGGVAAFDLSTGVISPGGVGFDITCGVRLIRTNLIADEAREKMEPLMHELSRNVPAGVGSRGKVRLTREQLAQVMRKGVVWPIKSGYGWEEDAEFTEEGGFLEGADPGKVSDRAYQRGIDQLGTLGAGNHFVEVQRVEEIYDEKVASAFGLFLGQLTVMVHCGSRGLGHQICSDYVKVMDKVARRIGLELPDRQLACAPIDSPEGKDYYAAMACAANFARANRHVIGHFVRQSFEFIFGKGASKMGMTLLYDVAHNIAKFEEHVVDGKRMKLCVHRKGATRAFGPGHPEIPAAYREIGQPVIIPGDMRRSSHVLVGTEQAMKESFGSTCHGAGRLMSRTQAKKRIRGEDLRRSLEQQGIVVKVGKLALLAEEAPEAYKDVNRVVDVCEGAGLSHKVVRLKPLGVLKG